MNLTRIKGPSVISLKKTENFVSSPSVESSEVVEFSILVPRNDPLSTRFHEP